MAAARPMHNQMKWIFCIKEDDDFLDDETLWFIGKNTAPHSISKASSEEFEVGLKVFNCFSESSWESMRNRFITQLKKLHESLLFFDSFQVFTLIGFGSNTWVTSAWLAIGNWSQFKRRSKSGVLMMDFVGENLTKREKGNAERWGFIPNTSHAHFFLFLFLFPRRNISQDEVEVFFLSNIRIWWWDWKEIFVDPFFLPCCSAVSTFDWIENVLNIGIHHTKHICPISTLFKCTFLCHFLHSCFRLPPIFCWEPLYRKRKAGK